MKLLIIFKLAIIYYFQSHTQANLQTVNKPSRNEAEREESVLTEEGAGWQDQGTEREHPTSGSMIT